MPATATIHKNGPPLGDGPYSTQRPIHAQRVIALNAARILEAATATQPSALLTTNLAEQQPLVDEMPAPNLALLMYGCLNCGNLMEMKAETPEECDLCGSRLPEFEYFGPYYSHTPERLEWLNRQQALTILRLAVKRALVAVDGGLLMD